MPSTNVVELDESSGTAPEKTPKGWAIYWTDEMEAAGKRTRIFLKQGNLIVKRYLDERAQSTGETLQTSGMRGVQTHRLNLFHANITTLQSMLFGSTPKIEVSREHHDPDDDNARVASVLFQRMLEADTLPSGEDLGTVLRAALQDRLLPGLGIARVMYNVEMGKEQQLNPVTMEPEEVDAVISESCDLSYIHWQDVRWGWARTWKEIPWLGYRSWLTKAEATKRFGKKKADKLEYKNQMPTGEDNKDQTADADQKDNVEKAEIWEFWHKAEMKVFWWSKGVELILDSEDDPLQLSGFFPSPKPLVANPTTTLFLPHADFAINQDLYNEIDELQSRIVTLTQAVKAVGVYDENAGDAVGRVFKEAVENDLIPVANWAMFSEKGGMQGTIDWFPIESVAAVLQILIGVRDQTIELLYQVTGMSDIMRGGNTQQYTSDGTNQLKAKMGSIRIQALQDEFARFASDLDGLKAEVISKHFDQKTIFQQSNAQFLPEADRDKIGPAIELMQSQDLVWRVDIRPESIAMVDYAQLKSERTEFLTAMATFLQSAMTAAKEVPGSLPFLLEMMKWGMAGFKGANYLEGIMDQAIDMAKKAPPKEDDKGKADQAKMQGEMQKIQAKLAADMQIIQAKGQAELQKIQADNQANLQEIQAKGQADMQKMQTDLQADLRVIAEKLGADLQVEETQSAMAIAEDEVRHAHSVVEEEQQHSNNLSELASKPTKGPSGE